MDLNIDNELKKICASIEQESLNENEWAKRESDDEFQTEHYCGGFDADENAFCFSYFSPNGIEYWFQFSLSEVSLIRSGQISKFIARERE